MKGKTKSGVSTISLVRLQYIRWVTVDPTQKTRTKKPLHVPGINSPSSGGKVYVCGKCYYYEDGTISHIHTPSLLRRGCGCPEHVEVS
jgi:hypothetical protein